MDVWSYLVGKAKGGGGGGSAKLQTKSVTITENTITNVTPSSGYDGLSQVNITTNVSSLTFSPSYITFQQQADLQEIDLTGINSEYCINLENMFQNCEMLTSINWGTFYENTYNVQSISYMFNGCYEIQSIDLSQFDFTALTDMQYAFADCYQLMFIDLRTIDFTNLLVYQGMLDNVDYACTIVVADATQQDWFTSNFPDYLNVITAEEYDGA